jgi:ferritin-like metal-binding protein YciE
MADAVRNAARAALIGGLRDAHAMERRAVAVLGQQARCLAGHPAFLDRTRRHAAVSERQVARIGALLDRLGARPPALRGFAAARIGLAQAMLRQASDDAMLRATLANAGAEGFEIAAYGILGQLARMAGAEDVRAEIDSALREERAMAGWIEDRLPDIVRGFVEIVAVRSEVAAGPRRPPAEPAGDPDLTPGRDGRSDAADRLQSRPGPRTDT